MSYFEEGLVIAQQYYAMYKVWDVDTKTIFKDFNLGMWWVSIKKSITIGSLTDDKVAALKDTNIDFGIVPLYWEEWFKCYEDWSKNSDKIKPLEKELYNGTYYIGKWYRRNKQIIKVNTNNEVIKNPQTENKTFLKWRNYLEICKKIAENSEYIKSLDIYELRKIQAWYMHQNKIDLKGWKKDEFDKFQTSNSSKMFNYRINSFYNQLKYDNKVQNSNNYFKEKNEALLEKRKNSFSDAIVSEWVMYKNYNVYKDSFVETKKNVNYFEVSIAISNLFSEKEFIEYINKNKKNLVIRARMDIEAPLSNRKEELGYRVEKTPDLKDYVPALKEKYKLNKLVYGLSSRIVTALFFKNEQLKE